MHLKSLPWHFLVCSWLMLSCLGLFANDPFDRTDAFEFYNLEEVRVSSTWVHPENGHTFDPLQLFGLESAFPSQEGPNGHYAFHDHPKTYFNDIDWVEWETAAYVALDGYMVATGHGDWFATDTRRVRRVTFKAILEEGGPYVIIDSFEPNYSITNMIQHPLNGLGVSPNSRSFSAPVAARFWRMEFDRAPRDGHIGSRVVEIDAVVHPNADLPSVRIKNPDFNAVLNRGEDVTVQVEAQDDEGIKRVKVLLGEEPLPFTNKSGNTHHFLWKNPQPGLYTITAYAMDNLGGEAMDSRPIIVGSEPLPTIKLLVPRIGDGFIHFDVDGGIEGEEQTIFWSSDLVTWTPIKNVQYPGELWTFAEPLPQGKMRFYKVGVPTSTEEEPFE